LQHSFWYPRCFKRTRKTSLQMISLAAPSSGRAVEAIIWGIALRSTTNLMYQAMVRETKGTFNQIVYWSRLPAWKNQTLTPNPDAIYLMPFLNTKEVGPVVLEISAGR